MKILHLADLHLGKKVNDFCMLEEQKYVLKQALELIDSQNIEALLIAGDVFDRAIPPADAMEIFSTFLFELSKRQVKTFIISGNHDNDSRLSYHCDFLVNSNIFISKPFNGNIEKITLNDDIDIFLLPYLTLCEIKKFFPDEKIDNLNDGFKILLDKLELDKNKKNIILAHQFVVGCDVILSDSEQKSVGGLDEISYLNFEKFDYCALGHLHCSQRMGLNKIRYAGSILKYSLSEINQKKSFCVLNVSKNDEIVCEFFDIKFIHEMKQYRGYIEEFLNENFYSKINKDDYIHFILLDESVFDAKKKLSMIYPNIILLEFDNTFTRNFNSNISASGSVQKNLYEHFCDFYKLQLNDDISKAHSSIIKDVINSGGLL